MAWATMVCTWRATHLGANSVKGGGSDHAADQSSLTDWLRLIQAEYLEIPGVRLTTPPVQRCGKR
jgi:hypothetical protein